jgi:hypothetical protein
MKRALRFLVVGLCLLPLRSWAVNPGAGGPESIGKAEEETFELRMERVLKKEGHEALFARLQREQRENPRPYVAAWLANYLIYGDALGLPGRRDDRAGLAMARKAMADGSLFGKELVGRALVDGHGVPQRMPKEGALLLQEAADAGRYTAMAELGKLNFFGYGVPRDLARALVLARQAAYRGSPDMLYNFGQWMEDGRAGLPVNVERACNYYLEAAEWGVRAARVRLEALEKAGNAEARISRQLLLLFDLVNGYDFTNVRIKRAVQLLEAERAGEARVQVAVAQVRMEIRLPVYDPAKAWAGLAAAAQRGDEDARYFQAEMLRRGIGRKKDPEAAIAQIQALADGGNAHAMGRLGWLYYWGEKKGSEPPKDEAKAFAYTRAAAHAGDQFSILNVGFMYEHGIGTPVNYYLSARYFSIAEDIGWREATEHKNAALAQIKD